MGIGDILSVAVQNKASDVHITVGRPPVLRIGGILEPQHDFPVLLPQHTEDLLREMLDEGKYNMFKQNGELDFAYSICGLGRFRVNAFYQRGSISIVLRLINSKVPTLAELELPLALQELAKKERGLVLVTGPAGSGKSTTLAALIEQINSTRSCHIITLEDPVEYMHQHKKSIVNQREIGSDSLSFANALRAALRQDPDVIMVGEMRDLETMATAITAAETGHLILATLHTCGVAQTIDRIIDVFPHHQQQQVRIQLADILQGIITQQLLPRLDCPGRVAALEILTATPAIRNLIREGKTHQINSLIQTGAKYGMQSMEMALKTLCNKGIISSEELKVKGLDYAPIIG